MSKKLFILLAIFMSMSLIGIIFVQAYFINDIIHRNEKQFSYNVKQALKSVSSNIDDVEFKNYYRKYQEIERSEIPDSSLVSSIFISQDENAQETTITRSTITEENYKVPLLFDIGLDSLIHKRIIGRSNTRVYKSRISEDGDINISPEESISKTARLEESEKIFLKEQIDIIRSRKPIHKRVTNREVERLLSKKLRENDINIDYEFAIYSNNLATKVHSEDFELNVDNTFGNQIFDNANSKAKYTLLVNFPKEKQFILSSIINILLLSILFTLVIIITFSSALYQLLKQRKIAQIKTDFINNMTHEFKTPIATINLALDSIKNPKIINDQEKVKNYLRMIRDENKRMHAQVENVLRISKLEKNELNISKERIKMHDLIEDAKTHIDLIIENRQGNIELELNAAKSTVLANESHFTNVLVNILDNAIKYSPEAPEIKIKTENVGNNILIKISDKGSGMSKAAQKRAFEKFYREHSGNIHNVKGHGLGLAYVKRMVDDHHGHVSVESEKNKGSTFTIKLSLIA